MKTAFSDNKEENKDATVKKQICRLNSEKKSIYSMSKITCYLWKNLGKVFVQKHEFFIKLFKTRKKCF